MTKLFSLIFSIYTAIFGSNSIPSHPLVFFDPPTFYQGVELAKSTKKEFSYNISGGITPHHLLPGFIIADFYNNLSAQKPKTIIIIGPNHEEVGESKALTSLMGWETPFGIVAPNTKIVNELVADNTLAIDEEVLPKDHAVAGSMPFIKHYLPETKVVPILLSSFISVDEARSIAEKLTKYLDNNTVLIAAVDFSHYKTSPVAEENNKVTLNLINNFSYDRIAKLDNTYVDSPPSIIILLMAMKEKGTTASEVLFDTNSGEITGNRFKETTSYFSIVYH